MLVILFAFIAIISIIFSNYCLFLYILFVLLNHYIIEFDYPIIALFIYCLDSRTCHDDARTDSLDFLQLVLLDQPIEHHEDPIEEDDGLIGREDGGDAVLEIENLGEHDRHVLVVPCDRLVALAEAARHP